MLAYSIEGNLQRGLEQCGRKQQSEANLELEGVLVRSRVDRKTSLGVVDEVFGAHIWRPHNLRLVQKLVHFEHRTLLVRPVWVYWSEETGPTLTLELHDDAADIGRIWHPQGDLSIDDVEIGIVLVGVLQSD